MSEVTEINLRLKKIRTELKMSQDDFARRLGFSRGVVANSELGRAEIRPLYLEQVCKEYNVSLNWLRTGEGKMFAPADRNTEISSFVGGILADQSDSFKRRLIAALAVLDEDDWATLAKIAERISKQNED